MLNQQQLYIEKSSRRGDESTGILYVYLVEYMADESY